MAGASIGLCDPIVPENGPQIGSPYKPSITP